MACQVFSFNNQQSTVRGYLAAIKFSHKLYLGWEPPTSHCTIEAVGKGIDRIRGTHGKKAQVRLPLTWSILPHGYLTVTEFKDGGLVMVALGAIIFFTVSSVGVVRVRERIGSSGVLLDSRLRDIFPRRCSG